jgi:hypothetical protein
MVIGLSMIGCGGSKDGSNTFVFPFTINFSAGAGGGTAPASQTVNEGDNITLPGQGNMIAPPGRVFDRWNLSNLEQTYGDGGWGMNNPLNGGSYYRNPGDSITFGNSYGNWGDPFDSFGSIFAEWKASKYPQEGVYVGLISFAGDASVITPPQSGYPYAAQNFDFLDSSGFTAMNNTLTLNYEKSITPGTSLFYAVHKAIANLTADSSEFTSGISSVNIITFTDGLDNGSFGASTRAPIEGKTEMSSTAYANYINTEIKNRKINGVPITAYSIGVMGSDVGDTAQFETNLNNLASSSDNVEQITDFEDLEGVFTEIAENLTYGTNFVMTATQNDPGTIIRMTFDVIGTGSADAAASTKYIEGTLNYSNGVWTFTDIKYEGISSDTDSGASLIGTIKDNNIEFSFKNIVGYNQFDTIQQWTKSPSGTIWQRNSEYSSGDATSSSTIIVQLVLDASSSLSDEQIAQIRAAAKQFINTLPLN